MPFDRNMLGRSIRNMGAAALRDLARQLLGRNPTSLDEARRTVRARPLQNWEPEAPPVIPGRSRPQPRRIPDYGEGADLAGSVFSTQREPQLPGERRMSEEILTPQSSNVFAFQYDYEASQLLVTYKANAINPDSVMSGVESGSGRRRGGRSQLLGSRGSTVMGKTNERGPVYAYFDVPARVFDNMKRAHSKGKFVWDTLRIRGTVYGHKYRYALLHGQVTPGVGGVYIPRKATPKGFRSRSVADLGKGRRSFQTSTLPQQDGFSTRPTPSRR